MRARRARRGGADAGAGAGAGAAGVAGCGPLPGRVVAVAGGAGAAAAAAAARALVGHLLYLRGQAPAPLAELRAQAEGLADEALAGGGGSPRGRRRRRRGEAGGRLQRRRLARFLGAADGLLKALGPEALAPWRGGEVRPCLIVLGPSVTRPLEAYVLRCRGPASPGAGSGPAPAGAERELRKVQQRVLRAMVAEEGRAPEPRAAGRPTKLSVLVQARAGEPTPPEFQPLREFRLDRLREPPVAVELSPSSGRGEAAEVLGGAPGGVGGSGGAEGAAEGDPGHVWHKCSHTVRGLPAGAAL